MHIEKQSTREGNDNVSFLSVGLLFVLSSIIIYEFQSNHLLFIFLKQIY